jgi:hypothetical protein
MAGTWPQLLAMVLAFVALVALANGPTRRVCWLLYGITVVYAVDAALTEISRAFFVPLALAIMAPIIVNIVAFHLYANRTGIEIALVVLAIELFLAFAYRKAFAGVLSPRTVTESARPPDRSGSGPS